MAFLKIDDGTGTLEAIVFPRVYAQAQQVLEPNEAALLTGRLSLSADEPAKLICDAAAVPESEKSGAAHSTAGAQKSSFRPGLFLRVPAQESAAYDRAQRVIAVFDGDFPLYFYFQDQKK